MPEAFRTRTGQWEGAQNRNEKGKKGKKKKNLAPLE